jgi:LacI family transcriptional regulator
MPTIKDVAKKANVSIATVSRVLNQHPKVDPLLKKRVLEAVETLRYVPNSNARSLVTKQTRLIGMIISDITNPFFSEATRGVQDTLEEDSYQLLIANSDDDPVRELRQLRAFHEWGVEALLVAPALPAEQSAALYREERQRLAHELALLEIPVVGFAPEPVSETSDFITIDEVAAVFKGVEHLLGLGHTQVAFINGPAFSTVGSLREQGYKKALERYSLALDPSLMVSVAFRREGGYRAMKTLLALATPPTAVFMADIQIATGALQAIHEAGKQVPKDMALTCIGNMGDVVEAELGLSTVAVPRAYEFGRIAAQLVLERLSKATLAVKPRKISLETRLIIRSSSVAGL